MQVFAGFKCLVQWFRDSSVHRKNFRVLVAEDVFVILKHCFLQLFRSLAEAVVLDVRVIALILGLLQEIDGAVVD